MPQDVFISYAMEDKSAAEMACASLESEGIKCWIAPRNVLPGRPWGESIINAIKQSKVMIVIFSANANNSPYIPREVNYAVELRLPVITVRIENVEPSGALELYLDIVHWLDAIDPPLRKQLQRLNDDVKQLLELPLGPVTLRRSRRIPKWSVWLGAGLLAAVSITILWSVVKRSSGPVVVADRGSPSPTPARSSDSSPVVVVNPNTNGNATVSPTQPPTPVNPSFSPPDDTDSQISQAAKVLGDPNSNEIQHVQAIGILEPLDAKSLKLHLQVVEILVAFLRSHAKWQGGTNRADKPAPDNIQAAIKVLGKRKWTYKNGEDQRLELSDLDLRGVVFRVEGMRANFDGARLLRTHLNGAILMETDFRDANFTDAVMKDIDVNRTDFCGAILKPKESNPAEMNMAYRQCEP